MSCLFPAYLSSNRQEDESTVNDVTTKSAPINPEWLENTSFKTEDALLLHRRHNVEDTDVGDDDSLDTDDKKSESSQKEVKEQLRSDADASKRKELGKKRSHSDSPERKSSKKKQKKHKDRKKGGGSGSDDEASSSRSKHKHKKHKHKHKHRKDRDRSPKLLEKEKDRSEGKDAEQLDPPHEPWSGETAVVGECSFGNCCSFKSTSFVHRIDFVSGVKSISWREILQLVNAGFNTRKLDTVKQLSTLYPGKVFINDISDLKPEDAFRIDRKSDRNNLDYESIYKQNVAMYKHPRRLIGNADIDLTSKKDRKAKKDNKADRYFSRDVQPVLYDENNILDLSESGRKEKSEKFSDVEPNKKEFLEISNRTKLTKTEYNPLGVYDAKTEMYIQGIGSVSESPDKDEQVPSDEKFKETQAEIMKQKTENFSRHLRENPFDIHAWLDFVKFQDDVFDFESKSSDISGSKGKRILFLVEKKQAVIKKAVEKNPNNVELRLAELELCSDVWDLETQTREWEKLILDHVSNVELWQEFLLFVQSSFTRFSVSRTVKQYTRCIKTLRDLKLRKPKYCSFAVPRNIDQQILDVFIQYTYFLKQSGYAEKSIALYQAMIEFNHYLPPVLENSPHDEQVTLFEPFWDSCVPRFGDDGAVGWAGWIEKKSMEFPPPLVSAVDEDDDDMIDKQKPKNQNWLQVETHREGMFWLPWRPDITKGQGQEDCEDPDRLVLVDDVTDCLISLSDTPRKRLVLQFLDFLGLAVHDSEASSKISPKLSQEVPNQCFCPQTKVCNSFNVLNSFPNLDGNLLHSFGTELFRQVCKLFSGDMKQEITVAWVRYEASRLKDTGGLDKKLKKELYKEVKKFCKSVLQEEENRTNLELWEMYARFEWNHGKIDEARKVFDMAICMHCSNILKMDGSSQLSALKLCYSYCELELGLGNPKNVLSKKCPLALSQVTHVLFILTCTIGAADFSVPSLGNSSSAPQSLKANKVFLETWKVVIGNCLASSNAEDQVLKSLVLFWTKCYTLFQYLSQGIKAASVVMEESVDKFKVSVDLNSKPCKVAKRHSVLLEQLQTFYVKLLVFHLSTTYAPLGILRSPLMRALGMFPANQYLLSSFVQTEASSHISGRVRKYFDAATRRSEALTPWLYAVYAEILRKEALVKSLTSAPEECAVDSAGVESCPDLGISNRIRSLFDRATSSPCGKRSIVLWRMFILFEFKERNQKRAKAVFYRALQNCSWAKSVYMDGVSYFPEDFQDITDLMTEKEIRIRCLPEELDILLEDETTEKSVVEENSSE